MRVAKVKFRITEITVPYPINMSEKEMIQKAWNEVLEIGEPLVQSEIRLEERDLTVQP